jgi:hypothetical protein
MIVSAYSCVQDLHVSQLPLVSESQIIGYASRYKLQLRMFSVGTQDV